MIYGLLGELEIAQGGQPLNLPAGITLIVLATLLAHANHQVAKADLLRAAWGSTDVDETQLYKSVGAIRVLLRRIDRERELVTHARHGYELRVPPSDLDMLAFRRLEREAEQARAAGRPAQETEWLREALALWRGPHPLANVPGHVLRPERAQLQQRRRRAAERLFDLEIVAGRHERALDGLELVAGDYPDDGRLCEQLMIVQYRCGDLTGADRSYQRHAEALAETTA